MSSKSKPFAILAAIFALLIPVYQIVYGYPFSVLNVIWWLIWIAIAVFLFIKKIKIGTAIAVSLLFVYEVYSAIRYFSLSSAIILIANLALVTLAVLCIFNVKAVKYIFYVPFVSFFVENLIYIIRFRAPGFFRYCWPTLVQMLFEAAFLLFAGLFFVLSIEEKVQIPQMASGGFAGKVFCSKCGAENPAGAAFCVNCGTKLSGKKFCARCGAENDENSAFCRVCGNKLS